MKTTSYINFAFSLIYLYPTLPSLTRHHQEAFQSQSKLAYRPPNGFFASVASNLHYFISDKRENTRIIRKYCRNNNQHQSNEVPFLFCIIFSLSCWWGIPIEMKFCECSVLLSLFEENFEGKGFLHF